MEGEKRLREFSSLALAMYIHKYQKWSQGQLRGGHPTTWIWTWGGKGEKRGDGIFCSFWEVCPGRWKMAYRRKENGDREKFLCFMQNLPKRGKKIKIKQVINNMPTHTPEPKHPSELRHCRSPVPQATQP